MKEEKTYRVATFYHPKEGRAPCLGAVTAYTLWYNDMWDGCIMYEVPAMSGAKAKRQARARRVEHEKLGLERYPGGL